MEENQNKIITIPNALSFFRLCLIPIIVWIYCFQEDYLWAALVLLLSGITDIADGMIARRFGMVSNLGKIIDPLADKLTQIVMLFCLVTRFRFMIIPLVLLTIKEVISGIIGLLVIRETGIVKSAAWHGKAATVLFYIMILIHLIWFDIPSVASYILIAVCTVMMLVSAIMYGIRYINLMNRKSKGL